MTNNGELDPETGDLKWVEEEDDDADAQDPSRNKVWIGKVRLAFPPRRAVLN